MEFGQKVIEKLKSQFPETDFQVSDFRGDLAVTFDKDKNVDVLRFLREDEELNFAICLDVTAVDWAERKNRFTVVYHVYSIENKFRLRLRCDLGKGTEIETVTGVYPGVNWYERETYDMYGITFRNHPDPRRMYMPEEYEFHPLRKDYPLMGHPGDLPLPKKN